MGQKICLSVFSILTVFNPFWLIIVALLFMVDIEIEDEGD